MSHDKSQIEETIEALKQQRDELALQIHLGNMEARKEFERAKQRLDKMTRDFEPVKNAVEESTGNVFGSLRAVGDELLASFDRIRTSLK